MAGLLSVFAEFEHEILRERIRAGIAEARLKGKHLGRPLTVAKKADQIGKLHSAGVSKAEIARRLNIGRTSVRRIAHAGAVPVEVIRRLPSSVFVSAPERPRLVILCRSPLTTLAHIAFQEVSQGAVHDPKIGIQTGLGMEDISGFPQFFPARVSSRGSV